jgi:hypothetical protein
MRVFPGFQLCLLVCATAALLSLPFGGQVSADEGGGIPIILTGDLTLAAPSEAAYWIGVGCHPTDGGKGLAIDEVVPNSPAAKAGLQKGDVVLSVGKTELGEIEQLAKAVGDSKGNELVLQVQRGEERRKIVVKPEQRGAEIRAVIAREKDEDDDENEGKSPSDRPNPAARLKIAQPPAAVRPPQPVPVPPLPPGAPAAMGGGMAWRQLNAGGPLPDDMEVTISKRGSKPAVVKVKQGDKSWKTTEKELGMLPGPAQAYAARMLGHGPQPGMMGGGGPPGMGMRGMMGGAAGGRAVGGEAPLHFQLQLDEKTGKVKSLQPASPGAPQVKQLPGGGLQIEIREDEEKEERGEKRRPKQEAKPGEKKAAATPSVKRVPGGFEIEIREEAEGKSTGDQPAKKPQGGKEEEVRRLREQEQTLRGLLDELRKASGLPEREKKE